MKLSLSIALLALAAPARLLAGPLQEAKIHQIVNDVKVVEPQRGARAAAVDDLIKGDLGVATGVGSRAELLFQDRTLTRLGAETFFSFQPGTRNINLDRGSMLLQVPKNLGGARIRAASVTASITGTTIMVEHSPRSGVKIVVLEGSLNVALDRQPGETLTLRAGKMVVLPPEAKTLPKPLEVDLRKVVRTSALVNPVLFKGRTAGAARALPSMGLIEKEITQQDGRIKTQALAPAALVNPGIAVDPAGEAPALASAAAPGNAAVETTRQSALEATDEEVAANPTPATEPATKVTPAATVTTTAAANELPAATTVTPALSADPTARLVATEANLANTLNQTSSTAAAARATTSSLTNSAAATSPASPTSGAALTTATGPAFTTTTATVPPAPRGAYTIDSGTVIATEGPTITTRGVTHGGFTRGAGESTAASEAIFGATSGFDTASDFDPRFESAAASSKIAVFRFDSLTIKGAPALNLNAGSSHLALVATTGLDIAESGWTIAGLESLGLATINGPITIGGALAAKAAKGSLTSLQLYARGREGTVTITEGLSLPSAQLRIDAEAGILLDVDDDAGIVAGKLALHSPAAIELHVDQVTAGAVELDSGTLVAVHAPIRAGSVAIVAPRLTASADISALTGQLDIGLGGVSASGHSLGTFDQVKVLGDVEVGALGAWNDLHIGGTLRAGSESSAVTLWAGSMKIGGGIDLTAANAKTPVASGGSLTLFGANLDITSTGINGLQADGADALLSLGAGGHGGSVSIGTASKPVTGRVKIERPISATTGANAAGVATGGTGGSVTVAAKGPVTIGSTVKVSDSTLTRASRDGGTIRVGSKKTSGTAIHVNSSGQLLSLLSAASTGKGGTITFTSAGGDILVDGGRIQADRGTIDIRNNGAGHIALTNATLRGDVVKVGALGANGQLIIGGGTISADTSLKLYGGTSNGQVRFTGDVTLGGAGTKAIAGKTVTIDQGKTVNVGGSTAARVFTDTPNYTGSGGNGSTTGRFSGAGAVTSPFKNKPAF